MGANSIKLARTATNVNGLLIALGAEMDTVCKSLVRRQDALNVLMIANSVQTIITAPSVNQRTKWLGMVSAVLENVKPLSFYQ